MKTYYVYILSNASRTLYVGVTNDLERRMHEHRSKQIPGFTRRYNLTRLVYHETDRSPSAAIEREKALKGWLRVRKIELIESVNRNGRTCSKGPRRNWKPEELELLAVRASRLRLRSSWSAAKDLTSCVAR